MVTAGRSQERNEQREVGLPEHGSPRRGCEEPQEARALPLNVGWGSPN